MTVVVGVTLWAACGALAIVVDHLLNLSADEPGDPEFKESRLVIVLLYAILTLLGPIALGLILYLNWKQRCR